MRIWTSEHTFEHPWETVAQAAWRKYPNPMNPSVVGVDVVDRKIDDKGVLRSHRLLATEWGMPNWLINFVGMNRSCFVSEHSEVNPRNQTVTLRSRNVSFDNFITIDEHLVYSRHPQNPSNTLLKQEAVISVKGVPMTDYLENMVFGTCSNNAHQGRDAMEWVISTIKDEAHELARSADEQIKNIKVFSHEHLEQFREQFSTSSL